MKYLIVLLLCLLSFSSYSQNLDWAFVNSTSGAAPTYLTANHTIHVSSDGFIYKTGPFKDTVDFDPSSNVYNLGYVSSGIKQSYVQKLDTSGNLIWAVSFGGELHRSGLAISNSIHTDDSGNVIIVGQFEGLVDFNPGPGRDTLITLSRINSTSIRGAAFVLKLNSNGQFMWVRGFTEYATNEGVSTISSLEVDKAGNIYTTGKFSGYIDFNPLISNSSLYLRNIPTTTSQTFLHKLDKNGNTVWLKSTNYYGSGSNYSEGIDLELDQSGNLYWVGNFTGNVEFNNPFVIYGDIFSQIFFVKYDTAGNFIWSRRFGGPNFDFVKSIATDKHDNVYLSGYFKDSAYFNPHETWLGTFIKARGTDGFVQKLDSLGNLIWVRTFESVRYADAYVTVDENGEVYTMGSFRDSVDVDPDTSQLIFRPNQTSRATFIQKMDSLGSLKWAFSFEAGYPNMIALDQLNNLYSTGKFNGGFDADPGPNTLFLSSQIIGLHDYLQKFSQPNITVSNKLIVNQNETKALEAYPNPTKDVVKIELPKPIENVDLEIKDLTGKLLYQKHFQQLLSTEVSIDQPKGIYFLSLRNSQINFVKKVIRE